MNFIQVWFTGYFNPIRFVDFLKGKPAPQWGLFAQLLRALMDSTLIYLPVHLMGRTPPTPSHLVFIPTERYYFALIWLAPLVLLIILLVQSVVIHVLLRLTGQASDIDQLINLIGMSALVVGAALVPWDWAMYALGVADQYFLGITHLVISLWAVVIMVIGLQKWFSVPRWLGIVISILTIPIALPFAIMLMRSPF
jgi:hypothetical protein